MADLRLPITHCRQCLLGQLLLACLPLPAATAAVREVSPADGPAEMKRWPELFAEGTPVVFRGLAADSGLLTALSHENVAKIAEDVGGWSLNKGHGSGPWNLHAHEGGAWNLRQVLDYYDKVEDGQPALQCFKSQGHLPALSFVQPFVDALPVRLLQTTFVDKMHWWMGVNGSSVVTGLHIDNSHNFFFSTHGDGGKKFALYPPWDADRLHVWPKMRQYSEVLFDLYAAVNKTTPELEELWKSPSSERYPNMAGAERHDVTLLPGDVLYIPVGWWHSGLNAGDVIGANAWFHVPNPFSNIFDQIFSQKPEDEPQEFPALAKLPKGYAELEALPQPGRTPPMGVHPDLVRMRVQERQRQLGCVRAQVRPFRKVFGGLEDFEEELTCLRGFMRQVWQEVTSMVNGDYPGGSVELWRKVTGGKGWMLRCPEDSPAEHKAAFERLFQLRHDRGKFSFAGLLENAYPGCKAKGTCLAVHKATGKALRSAVAWGKCKGGGRKAEL